MNSRPPEKTRHGRPRAALVAIGLVGAAALALLIFWLIQFVFLPNHIRFLINQRQYEPALEKAARLMDGPTNIARVNALQTQALVLNGEAGAAINRGRRAAEQGQLGAEGFYWLSIASYQQGLKEQSVQDARRFLSDKIQLPNGANRLARALAGGDAILDVPDPDGTPFRMMFPLEQAVYMGLSARQNLSAGQATAAAILSRGAFVRGNRNPQLLEYGALACVLAGDVDGAQLCLSATSASASLLLPRLAQLREKRWGAGAPRLSAYAAAASGGISAMEVARAEAWVLSQAVAEKGAMDEPVYQTLQSLQNQFPEDIAIRLSVARAREAAGDGDAARGIYAAVYDTHPSLDLWLKLFGTDLPPARVMENAEKFFDKLKPVAVVPSARLRLETEKDERPGAPAEQRLVSDVEVPAGAAYRVALILRSTAAYPHGPLYVQRSEDGLWEAASVTGPHWQLCQYEIELEPGPLLLRLRTAPPFSSSGNSPLPEIAGVLILPLQSGL